jgi:hypothetical protein
VSLNRCEQMIHDYLQGHPDERQHWREKVRTIVKSNADAQAAVDRLQGELWAYLVERSAVVEPFRGAAQREGLHRTSTRNLSEYLIRFWTEPRPKRRTPAEKSADFF